MRLLGTFNREPHFLQEVRPIDHLCAPRLIDALYQLDQCCCQHSGFCTCNSMLSAGQPCWLVGACFTFRQIWEPDCCPGRDPPLRVLSLPGHLAPDSCAGHTLKDRSSYATANTFRAMAVMPTAPLSSYSGFPPLQKPLPPAQARSASCQGANVPFTGLRSKDRSSLPAVQKEVAWKQGRGSLARVWQEREDFAASLAAVADRIRQPCAVNCKPEMQAHAHIIWLMHALLSG